MKHSKVYSGIGFILCRWRPAVARGYRIEMFPVSGESTQVRNWILSSMKWSTFGEMLTTPWRNFSNKLEIIALCSFLYCLFWSVLTCSSYSYSRLPTEGLPSEIESLLRCSRIYAHGKWLAAETDRLVLVRFSVWKLLHHYNK
jgi:hypothetical protein